jgi:hypothetical protein
MTSFSTAPTPAGRAVASSRSISVKRLYASLEILRQQKALYFSASGFW